MNSAAEAVKRGGVIVYPTDTVYGIGCDPFKIEAVERVIHAKRREKKPAPVLVSDFDQLHEVAVPTEEELEAAIRLWPGAVTIVMAKKPELPELVTAGEKTVGVRMPAHVVPLLIMQKAHRPLVGTSANISDEPSATTIDQIPSSVLEKVDVVVDAGRTHHLLPSTVVKIQDGQVVVLREGVLSREEIEKRIGLR
ncbi:translation factor [Candidatus Caldarchaeum subterraneum]|uniref:L-threonylcarbamoyladenylate synthase n=1 Tax=Caldiarchaeum subterraneum TaxID=311458 RepID=E6N7J8_CALS0|nr:translation factor [Candidatus Caldarchaeum subterraneum]BAJ51101.1 translation factor [Candidatus Caldarchaeum subterraneum]